MPGKGAGNGLLGTLRRETAKVAADYLAEHGSGAALHGQCWCAARDLAWNLDALGIHGHVVDGRHGTPFPLGGGSFEPTTGHTWVEVEGHVLDPTRSQLAVPDPERLVLPQGDPEAARYAPARRTSFADELRHGGADDGAATAPAQERT